MALRRIGALLAACGLMAACVSPPVTAPGAALTDAQRALAEAERADAAEYAPLDWRTAEQAFDEAARAARAGRDAAAARSAGSAQQAAEVARLRANCVRWAQALAELQASLAALRRQLGPDEGGHGSERAAVDRVIAGSCPHGPSSGGGLAKPLTAEWAAVATMKARVARGDRERACLHSLLRERAAPGTVDSTAGHKDCP